MRNRLVPNEWPWPLFRGRIKVTLTIALHLTLNISETVRDRRLVPKDHQQEMAYGLSNGKSDRRRHVTLKGKTRDPNTLRVQYLENYLSYRLQAWYAALYRECRAGAQIIFPESGRAWPRSRDPYNFWQYGRLSKRQLDFLFYDTLMWRTDRRAIAYMRYSRYAVARKNQTLFV